MRALLLFACLLTTAPVALAHDDTIDITVVGREAGCPGTDTFCFEVTEGAGASIVTGATVHLTFINEGASMHNAYVADGADADPAGRDTPAGVAIVHTGDVGAGGSEEVQFVVPEDASGLIVWCDVAGHEQLGMSVVLPTRPADGGAPAAQGDEEENSSPIAWLLPLAALAAAAIGRRR